jgi:hypothetical protein
MKPPRLYRRFPCYWEGNGLIRITVTENANPFVKRVVLAMPRESR